MAENYATQGFFVKLEDEVMIIWSLFNDKEKRELWLEYCQDNDFNDTPIFEEFITLAGHIQIAVQRRVLKGNGILR